MPNDTKSIQNRQFLGQHYFPLEKKKIISEIDKKSGSFTSSSCRRTTFFFFSLTPSLVTHLPAEAYDFRKPRWEYFQNLLYILNFSSIFSLFFIFSHAKFVGVFGNIFRIFLIFLLFFSKFSYVSHFFRIFFNFFQ